MKNIMFIALMLTGLALSAQIPCKGKTKAGSACKSKFVSKSGYCHAHDPNKPVLTPEQKKNRKLIACVKKTDYTDFSCDSCYKVVYGHYPKD